MGLTNINEGMKIVYTSQMLYATITTTALYQQRDRETDFIGAKVYITSQEKI